MSANLIFNDEVYQIIGCSMSILNGIGHGLNEKPYENALAVEFAHCGILSYSKSVSLFFGGRRW